tara:strand:+ start:1960 stop:2421 length:462 start_codon:yes stop_codon:yes gene_type:complete
MAEYEMLPGTLQHIEDMVDDLRDLDIEEAWVSKHRTPRQALEAAFSRTYTWVGTVDGKAMCVCGTTPATTISAIGFPWLYGTNLMTQHSRVFLRGSREYIAAMKREFVFLRGYVYTENSTSQRWLKWLGFTLHPAEPYGVEQKLFHPFHMEGK